MRLCPPRRRPPVLHNITRQQQRCDNTAEAHPGERQPNSKALCVDTSEKSLWSMRDARAHQRRRRHNVWHVVYGNRSNAIRFVGRKWCPQVFPGCHSRWLLNVECVMKGNVCASNHSHMRQPLLKGVIFEIVRPSDRKNTSCCIRLLFELLMVLCNVAFFIPKTYRCMIIPKRALDSTEDVRRTEE